MKNPHLIMKEQMLFGILPEEIFSCLFSCCHIYRRDARLRVRGTPPTCPALLMIVGIRASA